jgi:hypothetical protein
MSGIYHVYAKYSSGDQTRSAIYGRYLLTCNSRYDADELFRAMLDLRINGSPFFTKLTRQSPQFWSFDGLRAHDCIMAIQKEGLVRDFMDLVSAVYLSNGDQTVNWSTVPNQVTGPDWVSDGTYFIRNRRQPNLYWWVHDTHIHTSEQRRTKFRIRHEIPISTSQPSVLIRKDKVTVAAVTETVTSASVKENGAKYVSIRKIRGKSNCLVLATTPQTWVFGDLINGQVGVRWGNEIEEEKDQSPKPLVVFAPDGGGDEWELC